MDRVNQPPAPFTCTYSPNVPEFFNQAGLTLAVSTYQAGKVIFLSALNDEQLIQLPRNFEQAMALGIRGASLAVACRSRVVVLRSSPRLAPDYPRQKELYETIYVPQAEYHTGPLDIHSLEWGNKGLWAVNTTMSCIGIVGENYSFYPAWKPPSISRLAPEDRCHLNGMAMDNGEPAYATAFNTGDSPRSWKPGLPGGGVLYSLPDGEIISRELPMPHTPRLYDGELYLLLSATGELVHIDRKNGRRELVRKINGFVRGMAKWGDFLFIAYSRLRKNSSIFRDLEISDGASRAGIEIIHLPTASKVGQLTYKSSVDEIFDLQVIPGVRRAGIINSQNEYCGSCIDMPDQSFWALPRDASNTPSHKNAELRG